MAERPRFRIMLSSTFVDLTALRQQVGDILRKFSLDPIWMEDDAALSDQDMIDASLAKVDNADAYVCIIGKRYGQVRGCGIRNPLELSLTELEFERAEMRDIPITVLMMHADYPVGDDAIDFDVQKRQKLLGFQQRVRANHRVVATFNAPDTFQSCAWTSINELRGALDRRALTMLMPNGQQSPQATDELPPAPPAFHMVRPFTQGHEFVGRKRELEKISHWARGGKPLLVVEAMGGMGKSMVTHRWVDHVAPNVGPTWAGRLWYSFYEAGTNLNDFCVQSLAYIESRPPRVYLGQSTKDLQPQLLARLKEKPWLIVMDGLERVLVEYSRLGKDAKAGAGAREEGGARDLHASVMPADDDLLRALTNASRSKLLISSRNIPSTLLNNSGRPIQGVEREILTGLDPEDALRLMKQAGITGDPRRMQAYVKKHFECHPLMVGQVAGAVGDYAPAPGNFDKWQDDPQAGGGLRLMKELQDKQHYVLQTSYDALTLDEQRLLGVLAHFSQSVAFEALQVLNPRRPPPPLRVSPPMPIEHDFDLRWLKRRLETLEAAEARAETQREIDARQQKVQEAFDRETAEHQAYQTALTTWRNSPELADADVWLRGAVQGLRKRAFLIASDAPQGETARYDLHPLVRSFLRSVLLRVGEAPAIAKAVADFARASLTANYETAASLADIAPGIEIVTALTLGGYYDEAGEALLGDVGVALWRLQLHADRMELLQPFFTNGWDQLPTCVGRASLRRRLASAAVDSSSALNEDKRAEALAKLTIISAVDDKLLAAASDYIVSYGIVAANNGKLYTKARLLALCKDIGEALDDEEILVTQAISDAFLDVQRGEAALARQKFESLNAKFAADARDYGERSRMWMLELAVLDAENALTELRLDRAVQEAREWGERHGERHARGWLARIHQTAGRHQQAIEGYEKVIAIDHGSGVPSTYAKAMRAVSLCAMNRRADAQEVAKQLGEERDPDDSGLSNLYLALGDKKRAAASAERGFKKAWADGPPYADHADLQACREVLKKLGRREPSLPLFNVKKFEPFEFEPALRRLIEAEKAKRRPRAQAS